MAGSNYVLSLPRLLLLMLTMMATVMTILIILERMITLMTMRREFDAEDDGLPHSAYHVTILSGSLSNLVRKCRSMNLWRTLGCSEP